MKTLNEVILAVVLASPVVAMAQTSGTTDQPPRDDPSQAERDRPQGGSTAGAHGRQDPTIKLSNGKSDGANGSTDRSGKRAKPSQGGTTAGANGAQDPTIKSDSAPQPSPSK